MHAQVSELALAALLVLAPAEELSTGSLVGHVRDAEGVVAAGATVLAERLGPEDVVREVTAGRDGTFQIEGLLPGLYRVTTTLTGASGLIPMIVEVKQWQAAVASLTIPAPPPPPRFDLVTRARFFPAVPLGRRSPAAGLRLITPAHLGRAPSWRIEGHDLPRAGVHAPELPGGLDLLGDLTVAEGPVARDDLSPGSRAELQILSGSNRFDAASGGLVARAGDANLWGHATGPVVRDQAWFTAAAALDRPAPAEALRVNGLGKLVWQVSPRNKVTLLALGARGGAPDSNVGFLGVRWESLLTDDLVLAAGASALGGPASVAAAHPRGGHLRLAWFKEKHHLTLQARARSASPNFTPAGEFILGDRWRFNRSVTVDIAGGLRLLQPVGAVAVSWDPGRDGRSLVTLSLATTAAGAHEASPEGPATRIGAIRVFHAALFGEREVEADTAAGARLDLFRSGGFGEAWLALHARRTRGSFVFSSRYCLRVTPSVRYEVTFLPAFAVNRWLSLGALILRSPRALWPAFFTDTAPMAGDAGSAAGWLLGVHLGAELGALLGFRAALALDVLNLADADAPAAAVPPRRVQIGFRAEY
jgi:Carboxypeptidase regulatory-like domain